LGQTHKDRILYRVADGSLKTVELYRAVNAATDPALASRALETAADKALNAFMASGKTFVIQVPFIYHDPHRRVFALVLPEVLRYRELEERMEILKTLASDKEIDIPPYVAEFSCVYGPRGLLTLLEKVSAEGLFQEARLDDRVKDLETMAETIARRTAELDARERDLNERQRALPVGTSGGEIEVPAELAVTPDPPAPDAMLLVSSGEGQEPITGLYHRLDFQAVAEIQVEVSNVEPSKRQRRSTEPLGGLSSSGPRDIEFERWVTNRELTLKSVNDSGEIRLAVTVHDRQQQAILGGAPEVRFQCHLMPSYPLLALLVGPVRRGPQQTHVTFFFNILDERDVTILESLAKNFCFVLDLYSPEYSPIASRRIRANLEANVRRSLELAHEHLASIVDERRSYYKSIIAHANAAHNKQPPWSTEASLESLAHLETPLSTYRAVQVTELFNAKDGEIYLVSRGYPLSRWSEQKRSVVEKALDVGICPDNALLAFAIACDMAPDWSTLVTVLERHFKKTLEGKHGLGPDDISKNWERLGQAREFVPSPVKLPGEKPFKIDSESAPVVSGEIQMPAAKGGKRKPGGDTLIEGSAESKKYQAALALAEHGNENDLPELLTSLSDFSAEQIAAVFARILRFRAAAVPHLMGGLENKSADVRQACALALSLIGDPRGIEPVCELLCEETEPVWREYARALGEVGTSVIPALMSHLDARAPEREERLAWALAFLASRQGIQVLSDLEGKEASRIGKQAAMLVPEAEDDNRRLLGRVPMAVSGAAISRQLLMSARRGRKRGAEAPGS
jgi:hypothetical protein